MLLTALIFLINLQDRNNMDKPEFFQALPDELLLHIALYFDSIPPSILHFSKDTTITLAEDSGTHLKNLSLTCKRWRRIIIPILFQYSRVLLDPNQKWLRTDLELLRHCELHLAELNEREMRVYRKLKQCAEDIDLFEEQVHHCFRAKRSDHVFYHEDFGIILPGLPDTIINFWHLINEHNLRSKICSVVVATSYEYTGFESSKGLFHDTDWCHNIWEQLFMHLQPQRLVVVAPPATLGMLLEITPATIGDTWAFDMTYQYLELRTQATTDNIASDNTAHQIESSQSEGSVRRPRDCVGNSATLLYIQDWTHLGFNEGSSLPAFSTYEHYSKRAPDILPQILNKLSSVAEESQTLTSLSYRSVFPVSGNIDRLVVPIILQRSLTSIEIQLLPDDVDAVLHDPERMGRAEHADIWLDIRQSYMQLIFAIACCNPGGSMVLTSRDKIVQEDDSFSKIFEVPADGAETGEISRFVRRQPEHDSVPDNENLNATLSAMYNMQ